MQVNKKWTVWGRNFRLAIFARPKTWKNGDKSKSFFIRGFTDPEFQGGRYMELEFGVGRFHGHLMGTGKPR